MPMHAEVAEAVFDATGIVMPQDIDLTTLVSTLRGIEYTVNKERRIAEITDQHRGKLKYPLGFDGDQEDYLRGFAEFVFLQEEEVERIKAEF